MKQKIKQLQNFLKEKKIDLVVFIDISFQKRDPNMFYFTGIDLEFCCLAIPKNQIPFLIVPGFEYERAKKLLKGKLRVVKPKVKREFFQEIKRQLKGKRVRAIGVTGGIMSLNEVKALRKSFKKVKIKDITKKMLSIRATKTNEEIEKIRKSASISSKIIDECFKNFSKFKTEQDILKFLKLKTYENHCTLSFDPIVASGGNASHPHHLPEAKKLNKGFLVIDFGVKYKGYCSDITRTAYIGKPSKHEINLYNLVLTTQVNAIKGLRAGKSLETLFKEVQAVLGKNFNHGLGHGIGVEIHESPNLMPGSKDNVENGQIFTVEPGYYEKDKLGIRIEDDVLIKAGKPVILTKTLKKLRIFSKK